MPRLTTAALAASIVGAALPLSAQPVALQNSTSAPVVVATSPREEATPQVALDAARQAFERGVMLARQERWSAALEEFQRSRAHADRPRTAFNAALALERLGRFRESREALQACLGMRGVTAEADLIRDAQGLLAQITASLSTLTLAVLPAEAEVRVDGRVHPGEGALRTLELDPGRHVLDVSATGTTPQSSEFATRAGERISRRVDLAVAPARLSVNVNRAESVVSIDDEPVGHGSVVWQGPPGAHRVRVEADGYTTFRRAVQVDPGGALAVEVSLSRTGGSWYTSPIFWSVVGGVTIATVAAVLLIRVPLDPDSGSSRTVLQGVTVSW